MKLDEPLHSDVVKQLVKLPFVKNKSSAIVLLRNVAIHLRVPNGTTLTTQGEPEDALYILVRGTVSALVSKKEVYTYRPVSRFGVLSLVRSTNTHYCSATCIVSSRKGAELIKISREGFRKLFQSSTIEIPFCGGSLVGRNNFVLENDQPIPVAEFRGIRYGTANRFEAPEIYTHHLVDENGDPMKLDALSFQAECPQAGSDLMLIGGNTDLMAKPSDILFQNEKIIIGPNAIIQSEDCHFLNIWAPKLAPKSNKKLPVMVYIHGGAFLHGSGSSPLYNSSRLCTKGPNGGTVVVTINYRLGPLGFLSAPEEYNIVPNTGLLDQIVALRWVHDNIAAFGGDNTRVTIFGESAGAMSSGCLLASPLRMYNGLPLFHRAILQSGASLNAFSEEQGFASAKLLFQRLDERCGTTNQSPHTVPLDDILQATEDAALAALQKPKEFGLHLHGKGMLLQPCVIRSYPDAVFNGKYPLTEVQNGVAKDLDLILGINKHEYQLFMVGGAGWKNALKKANGHIKGFENEMVDRLCISIDGDERFDPIESNIRDKCLAIVRSYAKQIREQDVGDIRHEAEALYERILTTWMFTLPAIRTADAQSKHNKVYFYRLDLESKFKSLKSTHALDIPLVFGNWNGKLLRHFTGSSPLVKSTSDTIMSNWVTFAATGKPEDEWVPYDAVNRSTRIFGSTRPLSSMNKDIVTTLWNGICSTTPHISKL